MKEKIHNVSFYLIIILLLGIGFVVFEFTWNSIWTEDAITYKYNFYTNLRISNISDIFLSQFAHYFTWNGRYVAHFICQFFLAIAGKFCFSVTNALIYILFIICLYKICGNRRLDIKAFLSTVIVSLLFFNKQYMPNYQIGYVWMPFLSICYLLLLRKEAKVRNWGLIALLFIVSIIIGNGQEVFNIGIGGALGIHVLCNFTRVTRCQWWMIVGFWIGLLFCCFSPGTIGRGTSQSIPIIFSLLQLIGGLRITYILLAVIFYQLFTHKTTIKSIYRQNSFFINALLIMLIFNLVIGIGARNQLLGIELFASIILLNILKDHSFNYYILSILTILVITLFAVRYNEIRITSANYNELYHKIENRNSDTIFIDLQKGSDIRFGVYLHYVILSVEREIIGKKIQSTKIKAYPQKVKDFIENNQSDLAYEYNPGEFVMLKNKDSDAQFLLHRTIGIGPLSVNLPPYKVAFNDETIGNNQVVFLPKAIPFVTNRYVEVIK